MFLEESVSDREKERKCFMNQYHHPHHRSIFSKIFSKMLDDSYPIIPLFSPLPSMNISFTLSSSVLSLLSFLPFPTHLSTAPQIPSTVHFLAALPSNFSFSFLLIYSTCFFSVNSISNTFPFSLCTTFHLASLSILAFIIPCLHLPSSLSCGTSLHILPSITLSYFVLLPPH